MTYLENVHWIIGDFRLEGTPHYRSERGLNDYEWCMSVMSESVRKYNQSPQIPLWGFGAQFHDKPYHIFQCGSSSQNNGARGLLHAYHATFQTALEFGHETRYDEVIQAAAHHSKKQSVRTIMKWFICSIRYVPANSCLCFRMLLGSGIMDWRLPFC